MDTAWIVVADSSRARIFEMRSAQGPLQEIEDVANIAGRSDSGDLRTDNMGRFYGKGERVQGNTAEPQVTPEQHEQAKFARMVADRLDRGRNEHRYARLYLVAAPQFLGTLRGCLDGQVEKMVAQSVPTDVAHVPVRDIEDVARRLMTEPQG